MNVANFLNGSDWKIIMKNVYYQIYELSFTIDYQQQCKLPYTYTLTGNALNAM